MGSVISTCKLIIRGSVLDDWKTSGYPTDFLEKITTSLVQVKGERVEVVLSSNPTSQADMDLGEALWLLGEAREKTGDILQEESFSKSSWQDLFVQEDVVFADCLAKFRRQMPELYSLLARLRTVCVPDPLLNATGEPFREDMFFRCFVPFEETLGTDTEGQVQDQRTEEFGKVAVLNEEVLQSTANRSSIII
ncbi:protein shortage in chiasmata 1 ortholog-like [Amia ocellicauda]|uniref:protein shortage in chiasmata 1 ortholog-like n=1 Tax=Amia ocellicauda TaxID=2972642 RepID=UPI0034641FB7